MKFPSLRAGQFAVVQAEIETGIILTSDGLNRHLGVGEMFRVFDSLNSALEFARSVVHIRPRVECGIYDSGQNQIHRVTAHP